MNRFLKSAFSLAAVLAALAAAAPQAGAQQFRDRRQSDVVLVTPTGEILDYVPRGYIYARDRSGNRVLIDAYGNVVATEMRARGYYPPRPGPRGADADQNGNDPYYADDNS